jgi:hypothetical protein
MNAKYKSKINHFQKYIFVNKNQMKIRGEDDLHEQLEDS